MDRRSAIKNISLGVGYTIAAPAFFSLLQSCKSEPNWVAAYMEPKQGKVVYKLAEIILPPLEDKKIPGAIDVNVPQFIDLFYGEVYSPKAKGEFDLGYQAFAQKYADAHPGDEITKADPEELEALIKPYFNITLEQRKALEEKLAAGYNGSDEPYAYDTDTAVSNFLIGLRNQIVYGYRSSEKIGKEVLNYDPIPGVYNGCIPLSEVGEDAKVGRPWSL
ncbi:MAG: gluconate 2-dehydrogenase subunit 3 family protein [Flavobacteriaceae bacterium]|nr:gluconate 2-dehydrogenase subunit 3 family protein [Flavobacteriaceae bacterium]